MDRPLRDLPADHPELASALAAALDSSGPALRVLARRGRGDPAAVSGDDRAHDEREAVPPHDERPSGAPALDEQHVPSGVAVVLRTSGSTGTPRDVMLSAAALRASGEATLRRVGGPGDWLLVLPPDHVAGLQVLARAALSGTAAHVAPAGPFRSRAFAEATAALPASGRRYTSLVPTQLVRLLDDETGRAALRGYDAVLLGGSGIPPALLSAARDAGVAAVTTYGSTETCGGCVYDGVPLDGVQVRVDGRPGDEPGTAPGAVAVPPLGDPAVERSGGGAHPLAGTGRVWISGPVLADGYLGRPDLDASTFVAEGEGTRWLRTPDLGRLAADGRLEIVGRADDVIITGGVNVTPGPVEDLLVAVPGVREACVVGVPDDEWGQAVVAVLVVGPAGPPPLAELRALVADHLGAAAAPRRLVVVPALPTRGPGKPDRRAAAALAAGAGWAHPAT